MSEVVTEGTLSALLGIEVEGFGADGRGAVSMPLDGRHRNSMGNAHGGAVFTLADMAFAAGCRGAGLVCVSAQCSISYLLPGQRGPLRAEAVPVKLGSTLAVFDIMVYDGAGRNIAKAVMTGYIVKRLKSGAERSMTEEKTPFDEDIEFSEEEGGSVGEERLFPVPEGTRRVRLDVFLSSVAELSRSRVKKLVEQGSCTVDGALCTDADMRVRPGQNVTLRMPGASEALLPEEGPLDIVYCDEDIVVVNKPADLTMHPCPSCPQGTLVHRLLARFPQLALQEGPRPGIVHRLDKDTSGLVIVALSERARLRLIEDFAARRVHKTYLAVTRGVPPSEGTCDLPIGRHPVIKTRMAVVPEEKGGRNALTTWSTLYASSSGRFALLAVRLFTGRTHQIRVHLAREGFPLWGDAVYGPEDRASPAARQLLHAWKLEFQHPVSGRTMNFVCPPPGDFPRAMLALERGMRRVILTGMPGCGKSAVLERMREHSIPVWSADRAVAEQYRPGADGWHLMRQRWGNAFFDEDGTVDRTKLTALLSRTPGMRRELERLIHPLVRDSMDRFFQYAGARGEAVAVAEVPLWFETGWTCPGADIAVIVCPNEVRHERLRRTRSWSDEKIAAVEGWQWTQRDKAAAADLLIANGGTLEELDRGVSHFLNALTEKERKEEEALLEKWTGLWSGEKS